MKWRDVYKRQVLDRRLIVYEDEQMIAVNKPAGMLSQKAVPSDVSLNEYLTGYLCREKDTLAAAGRFRPGVCNRLDRNTSGLVLAGKNPAAARELSAMLKERTMATVSYTHLDVYKRQAERR